MHHVKTYPIDLLLLDLNLNGEDGFGMLQTLVSYAFHTIIISANTHQAIEAFEYGVLDFIPKPFTVERLQKAMDRYELATQAENPAQYLTIHRKGVVEIVQINQLDCIKGAGNYSELYLSGGDKYPHDKPLQRLETLLPSNFRRLHRSPTSATGLRLLACISMVPGSMRWNCKLGSCTYGSVWDDPVKWKP
ncbi:MAG: response regulator [Bacteroidota bacterium]